MRERPEEESPILPSCGDGMFEYTYNEDSKKWKKVQPFMKKTRAINVHKQRHANLSVCKKHNDTTKLRLLKM